MAKRAWGRDLSAVTPVLGSVLILGITVMGVAAVMLWGAPTIQRMQDRNAQVGMVGEFEDIRLSGLALSVPDASRTPTIVLPDGELGIAPGTRFLVTAIHDPDPAFAACELNFTGWHEPGSDTLTLKTDNCRTTIHDTDSCSSLSSSEACLEAWKVSGNNRRQRAVTDAGDGDFTVTGADLSTGDWLFQLSDGQANPTVYAQGWLMDSAMHSWNLQSRLDERQVYHDAGAVFSRIGEAWYLESDLPMQEDAFGSGDYVLWLRTFDAVSEDSIQGQGSATIYLGLVGTFTRIDSDEVTLLRYDFHGGLSEPWCNALLGRNDALTDGFYSEDASAPCTSEVPGVVYTPNTSPITMEFLHADIRTYLLI